MNVLMIESFQPFSHKWQSPRSSEALSFVDVVGLELRIRPTNVVCEWKPNSASRCSLSGPINEYNYLKRKTRDCHSGFVVDVVGLEPTTFRV